MLRKIIYSLLERRHYWRYVSFSQVAELYASRTLRMMAVSMVSIFVAIYLYQNGYDLTFIMLYFAAYFLVKGVLALPSAYVIAKIGPKHATLMSNLLYVPALLILTLLPEYGMFSLVGFGLFQAVSSAMYEMSYLVNFSKVRAEEFIGKEIGYMHMLERLAGGLSPVLGGFVAFLFGPQATLIVASILFAGAALPLLFTPEPVRLNQKITYHGLPWRKIYRGVRAELSIGVDLLVSGTSWSLFVALAIFGETTNSIYAKLGILASITIIAAIISAKAFGMIVDRKRGGELLRVGVVLNVMTHLCRPFVSTPLGAVLINASKEVATTGYAMPFTKGMFDMADNLPGYRIVYVSIMALTASVGAALAALIVAGFTMFFNEIHSLQLSFILAAVTTLPIIRNGFPILKKSSD